MSPECDGGAQLAPQAQAGRSALKRKQNLGG